MLNTPHRIHPPQMNRQTSRIARSSVDVDTVTDLTCTAKKKNDCKDYLRRHLLSEFNKGDVVVSTRGYEEELNAEDVVTVMVVPRNKDKAQRLVNELLEKSKENKENKDIFNGIRVQVRSVVLS